MQVRNRWSRAALFAAGITAVGLFAAAPSAQAAVNDSSAPNAATPTSATATESALGAKSAGTYLDRATGRMVINVTDEQSAQTVRNSGAVPKMVRYSGAQLDGVTAALNKEARIAGTSWAVDPVTNQVVVTADSTVTGAKLAKLTAVAKRYGDAVQVKREAGTLGARIEGGDPIYAAGGGRCSLGFNVWVGADRYLLTAGHCGNIASTWYTDAGQSNVLGTVAGSSFPGNDYAIIRHTGSSSTPSSVNLYGGGSQPITSAGDAFVGESVQRSGSTTGLHGGQVTAVNATVNYAEGSVFGLIRTTVCAEPGDSGGSLFDGSTALGLTSGGSGNCSSGGTTYFQPVTEALSVYGASI